MEKEGWHAELWTLTSIRLRIGSILPMKRNQRNLHRFRTAKGVLKNSIKSCVAFSTTPSMENGWLHKSGKMIKPAYIQTKEEIPERKFPLLLFPQNNSTIDGHFPLAWFSFFDAVTLHRRWQTETKQTHRGSASRLPRGYPAVTPRLNKQGQSVQNCWVSLNNIDTKDCGKISQLLWSASWQHQVSHL